MRDSGMRYATNMLLLITSFLFSIVSGESAEPSSANDELQLLDRSRSENAQMLRNHFRRLAHEALDQRLERYEQLNSPDQIRTWQTLQRD
mgnify:FL=1